MPRQLLLALSLLTATAPAPAQTFVVNPAGGGTHTDLQTAINAAPAGAVIRVVGGVWGPLTITRSVTIVGENAPHVSAPVTGIGQQPAAITLQGGGNDTAVLAALEIGGTADGFWWNVPGPGVRSTGFRQLTLVDCDVEGHAWFNLTGFGVGASAITVADAAVVQIERCSVAASTSYPGADNQWAPDGATGVAVPLGSVVSLASSVRGGDAYASTWTMNLPGLAPCACLAPGGGFPASGGTAIAAQNVYSSGGTITGGAGSPVFIGPPLVPALAPYGAQPNGAAVVAPAHTVLAPTLQQSSPLRVGAFHTIGFAATTTPSLFAIGAPLAAPTALLGMPFVFVDVGQPFVLDFLPAGATSHAFAVPANPAVVGIALVEQRIDLLPAGVLAATNPVLTVVLP